MIYATACVPTELGYPGKTYIERGHLNLSIGIAWNHESTLGQYLNMRLIRDQNMQLLAAPPLPVMLHLYA